MELRFRATRETRTNKVALLSKSGVLRDDASEIAELNGRESSVGLAKIHEYVVQFDVCIVISSAKYRILGIRYLAHTCVNHSVTVKNTKRLQHTFGYIFDFRTGQPLPI